MCVNPKFIRNSSDWSVIPDRARRSVNIVPCGHCYECNQVIKSGYESRCIAEFLHTRKVGGCTFFYTLTYDDEHLPHYKGISCFNKKEVQKFLKRLRYYLDKFGRSFKYFISTERGSKTFRPHLHVLLFFNKTISPFLLRDCISKSWIYGFNKPGDNDGLVNSVYAVKYCAKYAAKDLNSFDKLDKEGFSREDFKDYFISDARCKDGLYLLPFHLQSVGLGSCILDMLSDDDFINGNFQIVDSESLVSTYQLPLYIVRKKCYDKVINHNGNVSYKLNAYGLKIKKSQILKQVPKLAFDYSLLYYSIDDLFKRSNWLQTLFSSVDDLKSTVRYTLHGCDDECGFVDLASYRLFFHHLPQLSQFEDVSSAFDEWSLNYSSFFHLSPDLENPDYYKYFRGFDFLVKIFSHLKSFFNYDRYKENVKNYNILQKYRSLTTGKYRPSKYLDYSLYNNLKFYSPCSNVNYKYLNALNKCMKDPKSSRQ